MCSVTLTEANGSSQKCRGTLQSDSLSNIFSCSQRAHQMRSSVCALIRPLLHFLCDRRVLLSRQARICARAGMYLNPQRMGPIVCLCESFVRIQRVCATRLLSFHFFFPIHTMDQTTSVPPLIGTQVRGTWKRYKKNSKSALDGIETFFLQSNLQ